MTLRPRGQRWPALALLALALCLLFTPTGPLPARDAEAARKPAGLGKADPASLADLKELQDSLKKVVKKVMPATVAVVIGQNAGSGVIVDKDGTILTAGHVSGEPDQDAIVIFPDGKRARGRTLGRNDGIDSGMIRITDKGPWPFAEMGKSKGVEKKQWVVAIGHPGGWKRGRAPVVRLGRVLDAAEKYIQTDCPLVGGDSGGPLFDMDGKVIGIHSRINRPITANLHVPVDTYHATWKRLVAGESWGGWQDLFQMFKSKPVDLLGFEMDFELKVQRVVKGSNADKAGLKVGDAIVRADGKRVQSRRELANVIVKKHTGDELRLRVQRDGEEQALRFKIGKSAPPSDE